MSTPTTFKDAREIVTFGVEFLAWLATGETLVVGSSVVSVKDKDGVGASDIVDSGSLQVIGTQLRASFTGGVAAKSPYEVKFETTTSLGQYLIQRISLTVRA